MKPNNQVTFLLWTFSVCFASPICAAQEEQEKDKPIPPKVEMSSFKIKITDPDGHPLEGTTVFPSGLRSKAEPGSHWGWPEEEYGTLPKLTTDSEGLVEMPYPKYLTDKLETGTVTLSVEHSDFVTFREDRSVDDNHAEVQLERGFRIAATAVDAVTGKAIQEDLYGVISGRDTRLKDWKLSKNGMLVSPVFSPIKSRMRIVRVKTGEPLLFSDIIDIDPQDKSRVLLKDVKLSIGVRVEGQVDESVKRPVKNGYVAASICSLGNSDPQQRWDSMWFWSDKTPIAEDGTFVFESLPRDEILQMIPICDDWVPTNPTKEEVLPFFPDAADRLGDFFTSPQMIRLDQPKVQANLKMTPATSVRVTVTDQKGNPLSDVEVASWPNQLWFNRGSQVLGAAYSTTEILAASRIGGFKFAQQNRYSSKTNDQGIVTLKNMPAKTGQGIVADLKGYEMPLDGTDRDIQVVLKPDEVTEVTIRMQPEGTQILDDQAYQNNDIADDDESEEEKKDKVEDKEKDKEKDDQNDNQNDKGDCP